MYRYRPKRVFFERKSLEYQLGQELWDRFTRENVPVKVIDSHNRVTGIPGKSAREAFVEAKSTLVIGVRKGLDFAGCRPSAHYQLPLATSCPGRCEYCYLHTTLGKKPYLRIYVNHEEILQRAGKYIREREPEVTVFEGAATSDPLPVEDYSGALARTISFFAGQEHGRFRFVTKFTNIDSLIPIEHAGRTRFRFSVNSRQVTVAYEHGTPRLPERLAAASRVAAAGYPIGFLIAPIILYDKWEEDYLALIENLYRTLPPGAREGITFELITHRFTRRAKANILELFPGTSLPLSESERRPKYGQFGYIKYVYPDEEYAKVRDFFRSTISHFFPAGEIEYFV